MYCFTLLFTCPYFCDLEVPPTFVSDRSLLRRLSSDLARFWTIEEHELFFDVLTAFLKLELWAAFDRLLDKGRYLMNRLLELLELLTYSFSVDKL